MLEEIQLNDSLLENIENVLKEEKVTITHLKLQFCCLKRVSAHRWKRFFSSINPIEVSLSHLRNVKPQHFDFVFWEKCGKCVFFDLSNVTMIGCNDEIHSRISHFLETTRAKWLCLDFPQSDLTNSSFLNILLNRSDLKNIVKNWRLTLVETKPLPYTNDDLIFVRQGFGEKTRQGFLKILRLFDQGLLRSDEASPQRSPRAKK
ncbi:unnamed protein product, partial [Mesorhabditis belari]|uniref:Uncharacterized protein n=1 Tax=Mesorhabditis belari TaxID=2138241 RepID=A0AAF3JC26_9BILA